MFAIASLAAVTLVGLIVVGFLCVRLLVHARRLHEEIARSRANLEPRYRDVRASTEQVRDGS